MIDDFANKLRIIPNLPAPGKDRKGGIEIRRRKELRSVLWRGVASSWEKKSLPSYWETEPLPSSS